MIVFTLGLQLIQRKAGTVFLLFFKIRWVVGDTPDLAFSHFIDEQRDVISLHEELPHQHWNSCNGFI